jgi:hypothetical protein
MKEKIIDILKRYSLAIAICTVAIITYGIGRAELRTVALIFFFTMLCPIIASISAYVFTKINYLKEPEKYTTELIEIYKAVTISTAIIIAGVYLAQFINP